MDDNIIIWGTQILGNMAYFYYKDKCNIVAYVDNDESKWGKQLNGVKIYSPAILYNTKARIILAMKRGIDHVKEQLYEDYSITEFIIFKVSEEQYLQGNEADIDEELPKNSCIVSFSGGLGNQMFQYAFLRNLEMQGKNVLADLEKSAQIGVAKFQLTNVFGEIRLKINTREQKQELIKKNVMDRTGGRRFLLYEEPMDYIVNSEKEGDLSLLDVTGGIFEGMYQSCKFPERIRSVLLRDFKFNCIYEKGLSALRLNIAGENAVSVHIRRGDYLSEANNFFYGEICTDEYYDTAMAYMRERVNDCVFYFFSNDIEWVKENYSMDKAIYVDAQMFEHYEDWYDMYLMSICKHNIIANSTFSWWGAWLNQNADKIVIAPRKWVNTFDYKDIYPIEWIQM